MSEGALLAVAPAVARGGPRRDRACVIRELPLCPERVWQALRRRGRARSAHDLGLRVRRPARRARAEARVLLLGGKAANIATMAVDLGLPVPPAFTITTEACRAFLATGWPDGLDEELRAAMAAARGARRAAVRRPGRSAAGLRAVGRPAVDARDDGHDPQPRAQRGDRGGARARRPATRRSRATATSGSGRATARSSASEAPADPWQQLRGAIEAVFRSWTSERARGVPPASRASPTTSAPA